MHRLAVRLVALCVASLAVACSSDGVMDSPDTGPDAAVGGAQMARLHGVVTRSAEPMSGADGDIYLAVFDRDPVLDADNAQVVGNGFIPDADLSADGASVPYEILDIAPRDEDYFLVAFLDDNDSVDASDPANAGPDMGDLLSLRGLASPTVTVDGPGDHEHDIDLNSVLPV